jgi:hypothetical protein
MDLAMAVGAMRQQLEHMQQALRDHGEMLDEIHDLLQRQRLDPPSKEPRSIDWSKWAPRLWPLVVFLGLLAAQIPAPQAIKIVSQLFSGG